MSNFRSSFVLLLIVLGVASYIYFFDRHQQGTSEAIKVEKNLFDIDRDKVISLKITNSQQTVEIEKKGDVWQIKTPLATEANTPSVEQVLSELATMQSRRTIDYKEMSNKPEMLKQSGLDPAATRIEFWTGKEPKDKHLLLLGRKTAVSECVYARTSEKANSPIFLINSYNRDAVDRKLEDLRNRVVLKVEPEKITRLGFRQPGVNGQPGVEFELGKEQSAWSLQKPLTARADKQKVSQWIDQVNGLRIKQFINDDGSNLNSYGLSTPTAQIWVQSGDKTNLSTLLIGTPVLGAMDQVYAKVVQRDTVFTLAQADLRPILDSLPNARDKHISAVVPSEVIEVQIDQKGKLIGVRKNKDEWTYAGGGPSSIEQKAEGSAIMNFLNDFAGLQTLSFVKDTASDLKPYGLDKPSAKVSLQIKKGDKQESFELILGKVDKQQIYAKNSLEPFIYALPLNAADKWPKDLYDWHDLRIFDLNPDAITQVTITPSSNTAFSYDHNGGTNFSTSAAEKTVQTDLAANQIKTLAKLKAVKWMGLVLPNYGLSKPVLRVDVKAGTVRSSLIIGADLPDGTKAGQLIGATECFALSSFDCQALQVSPLESTPKPITPVAPPSIQAVPEKK